MKREELAGKFVQCLPATGSAAFSRLLHARDDGQITNRVLQNTIGLQVSACARSSPTGS